VITPEDLCGPWKAHSSEALARFAVEIAIELALRSGDIPPSVILTELARAASLIDSTVADWQAIQAEHAPS
jgi:hypothetical protein